jgi:hypothetical protein
VVLASDYSLWSGWGGFSNLAVTKTAEIAQASFASAMFAA